ncbi:MAG: DUF3048 domain-containing protein [Actinomycetota bacterium]|nr:DUF3048 domain-containing protein [Actinomycetota bacterium]
MRDKTSRHLWKVFVVLLSITLLTFSTGCSWFSSADEGTAKKNTVRHEEPYLCPLCGLPVEDESLIARRPVAVKIENDPSARPQSGLGKACVVYEEITEGGITRFIAIYLCRDPDPIGPIRSARPDDIDMIYPYNALLCHCGGAPYTLSMIKSSGIADLDELGGCGAYWRFRGRRAPHNLYAGIPQLRQAGDALYPFEGEVSSPFEFMDGKEVAEIKAEREEMAVGGAPQSNVPPEGGVALIPINGVHIPYKKVCQVKYSYDPASGKFLRFIDGIQHTDYSTGEPVMVDNVIIQYIQMGSSVIKDVRGTESPSLGVIGSGRAQVLTLGTLIDANWRKDSRSTHTRYFTNDGEEIPLKPGSVWIQLLPATQNAIFE